MNYLHKANRLLITGRSGTGKTEFCIRYLNAISHRYDKIFIFDPECEFASRMHLPIHETEQDLQTFISSDNEQVIQCYTSDLMYSGDRQTGLEFYCEYVYQCAQTFDGLKLFCTDELQRVLNTQTLPADFSCVIETGRRHEIDTVIIAQQFNLIHNRLRNQATQVCTFQHNDTRAIEPLIEYGFDEEEIRDLQEGEFICRLQTGVQSQGNIFAIDNRGRHDPSSTQDQTRADSAVRETPEDDPDGDSVE